MLYLLFQLGNDRYALEANRVVEVTPLLALKKIPGAPRGVAGLFVYRGQPVAALDLCELTLNRPARELLSTRIIIIRGGEPPHQQLLGLIAEHATETLRREKADFVHAGMNLRATPFQGSVLMEGGRVIQLLDTDRLISEAIRERLLISEPEVAT